MSLQQQPPPPFQKVQPKHNSRKLDAGPQEATKQIKLYLNYRKVCKFQQLKILHKIFPEQRRLPGNMGLPITYGIATTTRKYQHKSALILQFLHKQVQTFPLCTNRLFYV